MALCGGFAALGLLFRTEIVRAIAVWDASTAYSHCWFVLPIVAYLAWNRRLEAVGVPLRPILWPALLAILASLIWLVSERMGIMEGRQFAAIGSLELLFLAVLGRGLTRTFSAALLYLIFLIPFGAFLTSDLQKITAWFVETGLQVLGIPSFVDQFTIDIPEGSFYVAEACAGLRFLTASLAFGVLYACLIFRSPCRRAAFIGASCIVPVFANGFRALGIVVLGHLLGSAEAAAVDHVAYGYAFFSFVILLLALAGLPFREDGVPRPRPISSVRSGATSSSVPSWLAASTVAGAAALGPASSVALDLRREQARTSISWFIFTGPSGCTAVTSLPNMQRFNCGKFTVTARTQVFPPWTSPSSLIAARRHAGVEDQAVDVAIGQISCEQAKPSVWRLAETKKPDRMTATALWIDGDPGLAEFRIRLSQARNSVMGSDHAPVLMAVSVDTSGTLMDRRQREEAREYVRTFLDVQGDLQQRAFAVENDAVR